MSDINGPIVRPLRENEKERFFEYAASLPDRVSGTRKAVSSEGTQRFQEFVDYVEPFQGKCFLVAEEESRLVGLAVGIYNSEWLNELTERYGREIEKRAHILGIAFSEDRKDILKALTKELARRFSEMGVRSVEYPTFGSICLTTGTDVLTSDNVDALIPFREAGFKISECYYSMSLDLDSCEDLKGSALDARKFRFGKRVVEIVGENRILGKVTWDPVENGKTSIDICVARGCRGKGLGTTLLTKALGRLRTAGVRAVELGVDGNNLSALKLYRKFGLKCKQLTSTSRYHFRAVICLIQRVTRVHYGSPARQVRIGSCVCGV